MHVPGIPMKSLLSEGVALAASDDGQQGSLLAVVARNGITLLGPVPTPRP